MNLLNAEGGKVERLPFKVANSSKIYKTLNLHYPYMYKLVRRMIRKVYDIQVQVSSYSCPVIKSWGGSAVPHFL